MTDDANTIITPPPPPVADEERESSSSSSSFAGRSDDSDDDRDEEEEEKDEKKKSKRIAVYLRLKPSHDHLSKRVRVEERNGGDDDDENNNLNGPRRLLAENLDYQQMELTTEDREDHTFNGTKSSLFSFYFTSGHKLDDDDEITNP